MDKEDILEMKGEELPIESCAGELMQLSAEVEAFKKEIADHKANLGTVH